MPVSLEAALTVPPLARAPFTTSQPFTYRDSYTLERYVEEIRCHLDSLNTTVIELSSQLDDVIAEQDAKLNEAIASLQSQMASLRQEMLALIDEMQQQGSAKSPVYGVTQPLAQALGGMYDNARNHGLFWGDYDGMQLTAREYDGLSLKAREYDLRATAVDNCVPGDFPGRSQFPYGRSMSDNPPAGMAYITRSEADARYVERNPTADNFDSKE